MVQKIGTPKLGELLPNPNGIVLPHIEAFMRAKRDADGPLPTAAGTKLRASFALKCARQIGFEILGVPEVTEIPFETLMAFDVGTRFHEAVQEILVAQLDAKVEVICDFTPVGIDMSCHADAVYEMDGENVAVEIKSMAGFGFLITTGQRKSGDGPGPKPEHVCQAAISAMSPQVQAQYIHMIYIDKDKGSIAEWMLDMDEPHERFDGMSPRELAENELSRLQAIAGRLDSELIPARHIPGYGRVENPPEAGSRDNPWNCRYCRYQPICVQLAPTPVPFADLNAALEAINADD